jgi:geranylgeranyl diphosphate synthase type I
MSFSYFVDNKRKTLEDFIIYYLKEKENFIENFYFYQDLIKRLQKFIPSGKLLRGLFVLLIKDIYNQNFDQDTFNTAAAMELVQSALLIHDDMMDNDYTRRGYRTIFAQYEDYGRKNKVIEPKHYGYSMGLCAGDTTFFLAFELITKINNQKLSQEIARLFVQEIQLVSAAQMTDMDYGLQTQEQTVEEIKKLYVRKTSGYSFSLPFLLGATLANASTKDKKLLNKIGENVGIAFQIKDDEIKLFGSKDEVGTDIGSDIRENKKTFIRALLMKKSSEEDKNKLNKIFGNKDLTNDEISFVSDCINKYKIIEDVEVEINNLKTGATELVKKLSIKQSGKDTLNEMIEYMANRTK